MMAIQCMFMGFTWILTEMLIVIGWLMVSVGGGCSMATWAERKIPRIYSMVSDVVSLAWMMGWISGGYWLIVHSSRYFLSAMQ